MMSQSRPLAEFPARLTGFGCFKCVSYIFKQSDTWGKLADSDFSLIPRISPHTTWPRSKLSLMRCSTRTKCRVWTVALAHWRGSCGCSWGYKWHSGCNDSHKGLIPQLVEDISMGISICNPQPHSESFSVWYGESWSHYCWKCMIRVSTSIVDVLS